jgi:serine/threonine protein kinase
MTLSPGARLGPYEVVAPIGAGGMGQVYRARDSRLGREVAIKVLPHELTRDSDVTIHDFSSRDDERWMIACGPLPLKKLLPIATGIAGRGLRNARNDRSARRRTLDRLHTHCRTRSAGRQVFTALCRTP